MPNITEIIDSAFKDEDIFVEDIPKLDLYMDQILTFFSDNLAGGEQNSDELLTKTMINNYTKEKIILPIKGKKYNRRQIMQLLCIMGLKQNLPLAQIKPLIQLDDESPVDIEAAYKKSLDMKHRLGADMAQLLKAAFKDYAELDNQEDALAVALAISACASYLKKICGQIAPDKNE